jgi:hypothetical protein
MRDPIVEEIHKYRREHARTSHYDLDAIREDLRAMPRERGLKVVRLPPQRLTGKGQPDRKRT